MLKILHCADIQLDSPFTAVNAKKSMLRRNELRAAFSSLMMYVKSAGIQIVLIAGDLFDRDFVTKETVSLVLREFSNNPKCRFVISPGNHDPYVENSVYRKVEFPDNVYIFKSSQLEYFSFDDLGTDVYGYAFTAPTMDTCPILTHTPRFSNRINLLCAHGDITSPISSYCPITLGDIKDSGFDYAALGHIHNSTGIERIGATYFGYSGCLEGRDFGECGYKGAIYAELEKGSGILSAEIKGLRFSKRRYEVEHINVTGAASENDIAAKIKAVINEKKYGEDTALRVYLEGDISPSFTLRESAIAAFIQNLFMLEIKDNTVPLYDIAKLRSDPTIKGAFFEQLLPMLTEGTPEERQLAKTALRYGLTALSGGEIIDF